MAWLKRRDLNVSGLNVSGLNVSGLNVSGLNVSGANVSGVAQMAWLSELLDDVIDSLILPCC